MGATHWNEINRSVAIASLLVAACGQPELSKEEATNQLVAHVCDAPAMSDGGCAEAMRVERLRIDGDLRLADNKIVNLGTFQRTTEGWALIRTSPAVVTYAQAVALSDTILNAALVLDEDQARAEVAEAQRDAIGILEQVWGAYQGYWSRHERATILNDNLMPLAPDVPWGRVELYVSDDQWTASVALGPGIEGSCHVQGRAYLSSSKESHHGRPWCDEDVQVTNSRLLEEKRLRLAELMNELGRLGWSWP